MDRGPPGARTDRREQFERSIVVLLGAIQVVTLEAQATAGAMHGRTAGGCDRTGSCGLEGDVTSLSAALVRAKPVSIRPGGGEFVRAGAAGRPTIDLERIDERADLSPAAARF